MRTRGASVTIATKDLRRRIRDRTAILMAVVLPLGLAWIFSLTLGGADQRSFSATYAVVDRDHGTLSTSFTDTLRQLDFVTLRHVTGLADAERLAKDGDIDAAFVLPVGFSDGVTAGAGGRISVVASPDSSIGALVAESLARSFSSRLDAVGVSVATVIHAGDTRPGVAARAQQVPAAAVVQDARAADRTFSATTFFAIGMAVFFLFFTIEFGVRGLLEERQEGTLARLLVAPIGPGSILVGKAL
ncbi:MAG: ABC transporter permease, partial [Actinomycetota bacterium]